MSTHHPLSNTEQQIASARGMHEAMRHQRDKAQAGLDAAQAEVRRQRLLLELVMEQRDALAIQLGIEPEWTSDDA